VKGSFIDRRLSGVDTYSLVADLTKARRPSHVSGRVHVWWAFNPRQWIKRHRASDRPVPLDSSLCWWLDVVPMLPRICRYEVRPQSKHPTVWLAWHRLAPSAQEALQDSLLRAFVAGVAHAMSATTGCRDNVTSVGTEYSCSSFPMQSQHLRYWRSVPSSSGVVKSISQRRIAAAQLPLHPQRRGSSHRCVGVLQRMRQAVFWSLSRFWTR
jgi:hypothetical protein